MKNKKGFTLAEVLITLGIIGVVAAMTIPTLINNYQKTQYVTGLKKAYSSVNQVLLQMAVDNNTSDSIVGAFGSLAEMGDAISSHYKVIKNCQNTLTSSCFPDFLWYYDKSSPSHLNMANTNYYKFITADGMSIGLELYSASCNANRSFAGAENQSTYKTCGLLFVDINSFNPPNTCGRDVFLFYITSNKSPVLYPYGGFYDGNFVASGDTTTGGSNYWKKQTGADGRYTQGRIMEEGWQMNY